MWMDLEIIILSKVSQTDIQISYSITYMWDLKYDTNELISETDIENRFVVAKAGGCGWIGSLELAYADYYIWDG